MENRERLKPIVESVAFLGRQNIPFRGHRDDGELFQSKECCRDSVSSDVLNEGNFRELLRFRVSAGDELLKGHLETAGANATYISKTTQNALIASIGKTISLLRSSKISHNSFQLCSMKRPMPLM